MGLISRKPSGCVAVHDPRNSVEPGDMAGYDDASPQAVWPGSTCTHSDRVIRLSRHTINFWTTDKSHHTHVHQWPYQNMIKTPTAHHQTICVTPTVENCGIREQEQTYLLTKMEQWVLLQISWFIIIAKWSGTWQVLNSHSNRRTKGYSGASIRIFQD